MNVNICRIYNLLLSYLHIRFAQIYLVTNLCQNRASFSASNSICLPFLINGDADSVIQQITLILTQNFFSCAINVNAIFLSDIIMLCLFYLLYIIFVKILLHHKIISLDKLFTDKYMVYYLLLHSFQRSCHVAEIITKCHLKARIIATCIIISLLPTLRLFKKKAYMLVDFVIGEFFVSSLERFV